MKRILTLAIVQLTFALYIYAQPNITLVPYATGISPVISEITHANDERLFVTDQLGRIHIVRPGGTVDERPFLDIYNKVTPTHPDSAREQGLLGLAFSPNYQTDGTFYINYTDKTGIGNTVIARYHVSNDPDSADAASEEILLYLYQPYRNHNGGCMKFGPDGYLYIALGDGGLRDDPGNRAQNLDTLLGKILRIDVSGTTGYTIPATNPFATSGGAPEIWAYGLRNPWRFSFDRQEHGLWIADVGQDSIEEINMQAFDTSNGGNNYGWRCYEGGREYITNGCGPSSNYVMPVYTYPHTVSGECSVTGGYVYRGRAYPNMQGYYFFADYCNGQMWSLSTDGSYTAASAGNFSGTFISTFGEDSSGELYVANQATSSIMRLTSGPVSVQPVNKDIQYSTVYPMPTNGQFTCEFNLAADSRVEIQVTDATGRVFYQYTQTFGSGKNILPLDIKNIAAGAYLLQLKTANGSLTHHKLLIVG